MEQKTNSSDPIRLSAETQEQLAAVLLQTGSPAQKLEALAYLQYRGLGTDVEEEFFRTQGEGWRHPPAGIAVEFALKEDPTKLLIGVTATAHAGDYRRRVETVFVPRMSVSDPISCQVYSALCVEKWRYLDPRVRKAIEG